MIGKKTLAIVSVAGLISVGALFVHKKDVERPDLSQTKPTVGVVGNVESIAVPSVAANGDTLFLQTEKGSVIVPNFLKNTDVHKDIHNEGQYFLGNTPPQTPAEKMPNYVITYIPQTQYFNIVLLHNPLEDNRRDVETYLMHMLGFTTPEQLCDLKYTVGTQPSVSQVYAGLDLKFSTCQDSVTLRQ